MEGASKEAKQLQFEREKQAAANIQHNKDMLVAKSQKVEATGAYRELATRIEQNRCLIQFHSIPLHSITTQASELETP